MRNVLRIGGFVAGGILIAFGIGAIVLAIHGYNIVTDSLKQEKIVGSDDMSPDAIAAAVKEAGLTGVALPTCDVAGKPIETGTDAKCFAQYMRIHALEASGGLTYSEMGRFATADGNAKGTNDPAQAVKDDKGQPVSNSARDLWVTETALTTALNVSYMGEQLSYFAIVVGIALLLAGIGFIILAWATLHAAGPEPAGEPVPA